MGLAEEAELTDYIRTIKIRVVLWNLGEEYQVRLKTCQARMTRNDNQSFLCKILKLWMNNSVIQEISHNHSLTTCL